MPSSIGHAFASLAIGAALRPRVPARRFWVAVAACAILPDFDAVGRPFGRGDIVWLGGHRAFTHSFVFAALLATVVVAVWFRTPGWDGWRGRVWTALALGTASHGLLDALAVYGEGVTFLAPFLMQRFESPWQPFEAVVPEVLLLWLPGFLVLWLVRRRYRASLESLSNRDDG